MKVNEQGIRLNNEWYEKYCRENDRLGGNSAEGNFVEGWSIIENTDYVKTLTDVCGLLLFGYESCFANKSYAVDTVDEWIEQYGADDKYFGFTLAEIKVELLKYYTVEGE